MRRALLALLMIVLAGATALAAEGDITGRRVALVVGNGAYRSVDRLPNAPNDARLIAATLRGAGFTLVGGGALIDLDRPNFAEAVQAFGRALNGADVALFYYAGHGLQVQGVNWLVPVDANPTRPQDLDFQMLDVDLVLRQMDGAGTRLNLVLLDACRNNPFGNRGLRAMQSGLAEMRAPEGTLISYATQPGAVAQDGTGPNSPYTTALAAGMRRPGLDVFRMFNQVGLQVKRQTGGNQQPWVSTSPIDGEFTFTPAEPPAVLPPVAFNVPVPPPRADTPAPTTQAGPDAPAAARLPDPSATPAPAMKLPVPDKPDPAAQLAEVLHGIPCAVLDLRRKAGGAVDLIGMALPGEELNRALRQAGARSSIESLPTFACPTLAIVDRAIRAAREGGEPIIRLPGRTLTAGRTLPLVLHGVPGRMLALDLFEADGTVRHLAQRDAEPGMERRIVAELPAAPGTAVLVAVAGPGAAAARDRPAAEAAEPYLAKLREAMEAAPGTWADLAVIRVQPPPAATPSAPASPRNVPAAAPRPAPSGNCAAILERAQLGESLSDADRANLRRGCR